MALLPYFISFARQGHSDLSFFSSNCSKTSVKNGQSRGGNSEMDWQQNKVERSSETSMVLPNVSEAVQV